MKKWYMSKTLWVNIIGLACILIQMLNKEFIVDVEVQATMLSIVNIILRLITKEEIDWE